MIIDVILLYFFSSKRLITKSKNTIMKKLIYLLVISLGIISCSHNTEATIDNSDIVGKWKWKSTKGGIGNKINETPQTTGKTIYLELKENYEYSIEVNGIEVSSGIYELTMEKSIYSGRPEKFIHIPNNQGTDEIVTKGLVKSNGTNKLVIDSNIFDGIISNYEKIN